MSSSIEEAGEADQALVGDSVYLKVLAVVVTITSLGVAVVVGQLRSNASTLIGPTAILGATSGFLIAGGAQAQVVVTSDGVSLKNMFRRLQISRAGIAGLHTRSGIYIILKSGRRIVPTAYTPSLGKRMSSNARASRFGQMMALRLGVDPHLSTIPHDTPSPSWVTSRVRWDTVAYMGVGAMSVALVAAVVRFVS